MRLPLFPLLLCLTACTQFPELDASQKPGVAEAPYPSLLPLEDLTSGPAPRADIAEIGPIQGRVSGLRARAARLQATRSAPNALAARMARLQQKAAALRARQ